MKHFGVRMDDLRTGKSAEKVHLRCWYHIICWPIGWQKQAMSLRSWSFVESYGTKSLLLSIITLLALRWAFRAESQPTGSLSQPLVHDSAYSAHNTITLTYCKIHPCQFDVFTQFGLNTERFTKMAPFPIWPVTMRLNFCTIWYFCFRRSHLGLTTEHNSSSTHTRVDRH